jgi:hypothetical protein
MNMSGGKTSWLPAHPCIYIAHLATINTNNAECLYEEQNCQQMAAKQLLSNQMEENLS